MGGAGCCDNNAFGEPCAECSFDTSVFDWTEPALGPTSDCPMCSGRVDRNSDAGRALNFATKMLEGRAASMGRYWHRQAVANLVADASVVGPNGYQDRRVISSYVASTSHEQAAGYWSSGGSSLFWWPPPWELVKEHYQNNWPGVIHVPFFDPENRTSDGAARCCIEEFSYPVSWSKFVIPWDAGWLVGVQFEAWIEYKDGGACWCDCCEFKQFVESKTRGGAGGPSDPPTPGVPHEDAYDTKTGDRSGQTGKDPEGSAKTFGSRQDWHTEIDTDKGKILINDSQRTRCDLYILDTPGEPVPADTAFSQEHKFTGRVFDKCHNNRPVATGKFSIEFRGRTKSHRDTGKPPTSGEPQVRAHDGTDAKKPTHKVAEDGTRTEISQ